MTAPVEFRDKYGRWALVTGASAGIGEEFARQLAAQGFNLVLAARREDKLAEVAAQVKKNYEVEIKICGVDLADPDCMSTLRNTTAKLDIGLLVSNAGTSYPGKFLNNRLEEEIANLVLQTQTPLRLIKEYGQQMRQRGRGGIILLSSSMAYLAGPFFANYVAGKAYTLMLAEALWFELREEGIDILSLAPGPTKTEGTKKYAIIENGEEKDPFPMGNVDDVVREGITALGRKPSVITGRSNKVIAFVFSRLLTRKRRNIIVGKMMSKSESQSKVTSPLSRATGHPE